MLASVPRDARATSSPSTTHIISRPCARRILEGSDVARTGDNKRATVRLAGNKRIVTFSGHSLCLSRRWTRQPGLSVYQKDPIRFALACSRATSSLPTQSFVHPRSRNRRRGGRIRCCRCQAKVLPSAHLPSRRHALTRLSLPYPIHTQLDQPLHALTPPSGSSSTRQINPGAAIGCTRCSGPNASDDGILARLGWLTRVRVVEKRARAEQVLKVGMGVKVV